MAAAIVAASVVAVPAAEVSARLEPGAVSILEDVGSNAPLFSIAYNPDKDEYLAVWLRLATTGTTEIAGSILDSNSTPKGAAVELAVGNATAGEFAATVSWRPDIEYNPVTKEYLLVYIRNTGLVTGRRITDTGQPTGSEAPIDQRTGYGFGCFNLHPDVVADPSTGGYVLTYARNQFSTTPGPCPGVGGLESIVVVQTLSAALVPGPTTDVPSGKYGGSNAPFIARNPLTGSFLVTHSAPQSGPAPAGLDREYGHIYDSSLQPIGGTIELADQVDEPSEDGGSYVKAVGDPVSGNWIALVNNSRFRFSQMNILSPTGEVLSDTPVIREGNVGSLVSVGDGTVLLSTTSAGNVQHLRQDGSEIHATSPLAAGNNGIFNALAANGDPIDSKAVLVGLDPATNNRIAATGIDVFDPGPLSLAPARLLDTRSGEGIATIDGQSLGGGKKAAGSVVVLKVAGRGGVPSDADAVLLNVTAAAVASRGYVTAYPCDAERPTTSNVNYDQGGAASTAAIVKVADDGTVCLFTFAESHLIADVNGYVPAGGSVTPLVPARLLETRAGNRTVDGASNGVGRVGANSTTTLPVAGRGGVSATADAVLVNVTAVNPSTRAFLTVYPCDADRPTASNLNAPAGGVVNNLVTSKVSASGTICVFSSVESDLIVDVAAFVPTDGGLLSIVPARLLETRSGAGNVTVDGGAQGSGRVAAGSVTQLQVDRGGVDRDATGVMLNVAAISPSDGGFMTVFPYPCNEERPTASNVNFTAGSVVSNAVFVQVGQTGSKFSGNNNGFICIYSSAETHLAVDVVGYTLDS